MGVRVKAYAKLNLALGITGVADGYHMLDSLVCSVDLYDLIVINKRRDGQIKIEMHGLGCELLDPENNNAYRAARAFTEKFKTGGADIAVYKNIPLGAGLGGSSADAAGVLNGLARLYGSGSQRQLKEIADALGSDTGYMLSGGFARLSGRGEKVEMLPLCGRLHFLMLCPETGVSTAQCYKLYDSFPAVSSGCGGAVKCLLAGDMAGLGGNMFNALYRPAAALNTDVEKAYDELLSFSPLGVNMTGSGSGVFALFDSAELCAWAKSRYRGKFLCMQLKSVNP